MKINKLKKIASKRPIAFCQKRYWIEWWVQIASLQDNLKTRNQKTNVYGLKSKVFLLPLQVVIKKT